MVCCVSLGRLAIVYGVILSPMLVRFKGLLQAGHRALGVFRCMPRFFCRVESGKSVACLKRLEALHKKLCRELGVLPIRNHT